MLRFTIRKASQLAHPQMKITPILLPLVTAFTPQQQLAKPATRPFVTSTSLLAMPICIVVEAEIKEDRMEDFLDMIERNAKGSRAEPGCIRFGELKLLCGWYILCGIYYVKCLCCV